MKKHIITLLILLISFGAVAQNDKQREKLKALKVAHITEQLDLTKKEAQAFWPIYNAHEEKINTLRKESFDKRKEINVDELSESEAKKMLLNMLNIEKQKQELENKYVNDLLAVLPATKIISLFKAERSFKRKMIEEFRQRRNHSKKE
ncbi:sensor of ECF-type sigma factor [Olleya aquimaris]|uniref:Sensor of ECF-type sigma factor n=1 Tax=Olleya aquimaris TaxID=639310 RepID=A0A327RL37_9FLAO|nr:sensor of ECF-type sigma factor [Olleya aquimaris]RAJ16888.1 hypothetical protein LY08_00664 [Olleya aquimaris]